MTEKLKKPKKGQSLKIHCGECNRYNPTCKHYDQQTYRAFAYPPGSKQPKVKTLDTRNYDEAVVQAADFKKDVKNGTNAAVKQSVLPTANDYSLADAIVKYNQYLEGNHELEQHKKSVSKRHRTRCIRFCLYFANIVKQRADINHLPVTEVTKYDVSNFYAWLKSKNYTPGTFNSTMGTLKTFFDFLITVEEVNMRNPFIAYQSQPVVPTEKLTLTRAEFDAILTTIDTFGPTQVYRRGNGRSYYHSYLKDGLRLGLLTGLRREEIILLKWNDIKAYNDMLFILVPNLKVNRKENQDKAYKYIPVNADLYDLLLLLGYENYKDTDKYILAPDRTDALITMTDALTYGFTHFRKQAGITKNVTFKHLRKTYISWVDAAIGKETGMLTSHTSTDVLKNHYIDPTILSVIEKGILAIKIFGDK